MAAPWICPRCGTATNTDNCPNCFREAPPRYTTYNRAGTYFAILQGPNGYAGFSRGMAIGCLFILLIPIVVELIDAFHRMR